MSIKPDSITKGIKMLDKELKQQELNRLHRLLCEREKEFKKAKSQRITITALGFTVFYFWVLFNTGDHTWSNIAEDFVVAIVFAGFHVFINGSVFGWLFQKSIAEDRRLDAIMKQIRDVEESDAN